MPASVVTLRPAVAPDAAAVAAIYNEGIAERVATFETRTRGVDEVEAWVADELPLEGLRAGGAPGRRSGGSARPVPQPDHQT